MGGLRARSLTAPARLSDLDQPPGLPAIIRRASRATLYPGAEDPPEPRPESPAEKGATGPGLGAHVEESLEEYHRRVEWAVPALVLAVWATATVALTYLTKWALSTPSETHDGAGFAFPTFYTLTTFTSTFACCTLVLALRKQTNTLGLRQCASSWQGILGLAACNVLSIWASDASLMHIGVALNQIFKATCPMPTMAFGYAIEGKRFSWQMVVAVATIVLGAVLAVPFSDPEATPYGMAMAALSTLAAAAGVSLKALLMSRSADNGLTPLVLLWYSTGTAVPVLGCLFLASPERHEVSDYFDERPREAAALLAAASSLAFVVNLSGNTLTKVTSSLTVMVASSTKQIGIIFVSGVFIEHTFKRAINWVGAAIFLSALAAYAAVAYNRRTAPKTVPGALTRSCSYVVATHASSPSPSPYQQPPAMAPAQAHDRHGEAARAHDRYESAARAAAFRVAQPDERTRLAPG